MNSRSRFEIFATPLASWIQVSGEDAPAFLQSQFSNDLRGDPGFAVHGLWLDHRARLQGESVVMRLDTESFVLASLGTPAGGLLAKLEGHVIADEVGFEDLTIEMSALILIGDAAEDWWSARMDGERLEKGRYVYSNFCYAFRMDGFEDPVLVVVALADVCMRLLDALRMEGARLISASEWKFRRIQACRAEIPSEIGPEETPVEVGLSDLCSLSKGCYLGQEVVNRQIRLERSNRSLVVVDLENEFSPDGPCDPSILTREGVVAGNLRASSTLDGATIGLAMIKTKFLQDDFSMVDFLGRAVSVRTPR